MAWVALLFLEEQNLLGVGEGAKIMVTMALEIVKIPYLHQIFKHT